MQNKAREKKKEKKIFYTAWFTCRTWTASRGIIKTQKRIDKKNTKQIKENETRMKARLPQ
jgi:hypothetical protein